MTCFNKDVSTEVNKILLLLLLSLLSLLTLSNSTVRSTSTVAIFIFYFFIELFLILSFLKKLEKVMIFPSKILAKFFDRLYLESGNYRLVIFLIVPVLYIKRGKF